jgi:hypothetical protein
MHQDPTANLQSGIFQAITTITGINHRLCTYCTILFMKKILNLFGYSQLINYKTDVLSRLNAAMARILQAVVF